VRFADNQIKLVEVVTAERLVAIAGDNGLAAQVPKHVLKYGTQLIVVSTMRSYVSASHSNLPLIFRGEMKAPATLSRLFTKFEAVAFGNISLGSNK